MLLVTVGALLPLAYCAPLDSTWVRGVYDDDDSDSVFITVTSNKVAFEGAASVLLKFFPIVLAFILLADPRHPALAVIPASQIRAPPTR
jgi:hypothetical protein